jgi:aminopeptidase-like protein
LPVGRLTRSVNGGYPEYHSSADDLALIGPDYLAQSLEACRLFVTILEHDGRYVNRSPKGEPRLGKRGLYGPVGGMSPAEREHAMLWVLNQSDGSKSLLDIARRAGLAFETIREASAALEQAGLLRQKGRRGQTEISSPANRADRTARGAAGGARKKSPYGRER